MKAHFNTFLFSMCFCIALCLSVTLLAQDESASPTPENKKTAYLRAWNYSYLVDVPNLAVFLGPVGDKPPAYEEAIWIKRGMRSPKRSNWQEILPGNYEIFVIKDDATAGAMGNKIGPGIPLPPSLLGNRQGITLKAGRYQTIILTGENGKLSGQVIENNLMLGSSRKLLFYKFNTQVKPSISLITDGRQLQSIATKIEQNVTSFPVIGAPEAESYQVTFENKDSLTASLNLELDFSKVSSCSIILAPDRYNNLGVEFTLDAQATALDSPP